MQEPKVNQRFGLEVETVEQDKLSSRIRRIQHQGKALSDFDALNAKGQRFLEQVTYLEDPLKLIEKDNLRQAVVLRSEAPQETDATISYYEVLLDMAGATVITHPVYRRRSGDTESGDFVMSDRLLERLAQDIESL